MFPPMVVKNPRGLRAVAHDALALWEVDEQGLDAMDRQILETIARVHAELTGDPMALDSVKAILAAEADP